MHPNIIIINISFFLFFASTIACDKCNYFNDIAVRILTNQASDSIEIASFSGCFNSTSFDVPVKELAFLDQNITTLGYGSIADIPELEKISFIGCEIQEIHPSAISSTTRLKSLRITNGNLKKIPNRVTNGTYSLQTIDFSENDISVVEPEAFAGLPNLKKVILAKNDLTHWDSSWFAGNPDIRVLDFSFNQIETLPASALAATPKVEELHLDFNEIESIGDGVFGAVQNIITYVGLGHNRLTEFKAGLFPERSTTIESLKIDANFLNYLPKNLMNKLTIKKIALGRNPWECRCLDEINRWCYNSNISIVNDESCIRSDIPSCQFSAFDVKICLEIVDEDLTDNYIDVIKSIEPPIGESCVKFD